VLDNSGEENSHPYRIREVLAARAPYFHNGSAESLSDIVTFYEKRFNVGFTAQEKADLIAFLNSL
jgi:cytochrome c peroxidase